MTTSVAGERQDTAQRAFGTLCTLAMAFVVYASLVPLAYAPQPLHVALERFMPPVWVLLGPLDRADWLANVVLFAPLSFAGLAALERQGSREGHAVRATIMLLGFALVAVAVEFAQIWFPPRSVTSNDLAAEIAGIALGACAWMAAGPRILASAESFLSDAEGARRLVAGAFVVAYVAIALFPLDIVLSGDEFAAKLASGMAGLWVAPAACQVASLCIASLVMHGLIAVCLGLAFAIAASAGGPVGWWRAALLGLAISVAIELVQLAMVSGISQGSSALARAAGFAIGYRMSGRLQSLGRRILAYRVPRPVLALAALGYAFTLAGVNGLLRSDWLSADAAAARLAEVPFVPFYYHYYVSEQRALASAIVHLAMYAPIGIGLAVGAHARTSRALAAWIAAAVALAVEAAKLLAGRQADPTDILLAAIAGYVAFAFVHWLVELSRREHAYSALVLLPRFAFGPLTPYAFVLVIAIVLGMLAYPGPRTLLALGLAAYALALWRDPRLWLAALPALLPVLDLTQWTGALYLDEFDLGIMVTLAVLCFREPRPGASRWPPSLGVALAIAIGLCGISFLQGLLPLAPLNADTFASVHSPANAWRVGRGILWCAALVLLVRRWSDRPASDLSRWANGMTLGLALLGALMVWERTTFAGWTNFSVDYRAVGALAAASTAGAQTEAYLAAAAPFALLVAATSASLWWRAVAIAALLLGAYAVVATVSRAALGGALLGALLFCVGLALRIPMSLRARHALAYIFPLTVLLLGLAALVMAERFGNVSGDLAARRAHWAELLDNRSGHVSQTLFGHGLGSYPSFYYWSVDASRRPSLFSYRSENSISFARVSPGRPTYLDQVVRVDPAARYDLHATVRAATGPATVAVSLCEKWILYSTRCGTVRLAPEEPGNWQAFRAPLSLQHDGGPWRPLRPTQKLSLSLQSGESAVDVRDIRLIAPDGRDMVRNGSFAQAGTYWLQSADDHWPWNTFSLVVEVLFEQGWLALVGLGIALAYVFVSIGRRATHADVVAAACAAALAGFLVPAMFDALIDEPRMRLLFGLLIALPLLVADDSRAPDRRENAT